MNSPSEAREATLVEGIRDGDLQSLGEFIQMKERPLMAFIQMNMGSKLRREVEPEDIFQEVASTAIRSLTDVDLSDRDPYNWLCQVCERRVKDAARHVNAKQRDPGRKRPLSGGAGTEDGGFIDMLVASLTSPSQAFRRNARESKLLEALGQLPEDQRDAIRMRFVENLSSKEIADALGKTDGATRVMLSRIVAKLKSMLDEEIME